MAIGYVKLENIGKRQADSFLSDCVNSTSGVNNIFNVSSNMTRLNTNTSKFKTVRMCIYYYNG